MIDQIRLKNFKCFEDATISLRPLTLMTGLNGMGKSSVGQALLLLRQSQQQGLLARGKIALNGDLVSLGTAKDALYEAAKDDIMSLTVAFSDGHSAQWSIKYAKGQENVMDLVETPKPTSFEDEELFGDNFQYLQAERIGPRTSFSISDYVVAQHNQLGSRGEYTAHFLSVFGRTQIHNPDLKHTGSATNSLTDQVEAWIGDLCPGVRLNFTSHPDIDLISLRYSFAYGKSISNAYRPTNVGFGLTYVLPVLVALLSLKPGGLLLVENPEAHLHPHGQVRIGELLARAAQGGVQVLVETHSDHVLNGVRLSVKSANIPPNSVALHYFVKSQQSDQLAREIISPTIDNRGRIDAWPDGFFDEWDKSLEELLEP